jgi:hypothetical protein
MKQVTDTGAIEKAVDDIIAANPDKVEQARPKPTMLGWFVGQVMKASGGKANPQAVNEILKSKLGIETMRVEVEEANAPALAFYAASGFVRTGETANCGAEQSGIPALLFEKKLG